jgi:tyrosinase
MRRDIATLTDQEWGVFVDRCRAVHASGEWFAATERHANAMMTATKLTPSEPSTRNVAHRGPAILPWHRLFLRDMEALLGVDVPYWAWNRSGAGWRHSAVWTRLAAFNTGWPVRIYNARTHTFDTAPRIVRKFAGSGSMPAWPTESPRYDSAPWDTRSKTGQRVRLERVHNTVHNLIGGHFNTVTSPSDPLFYMHHANVDRCFEAWRRRHGTDTYPRSGPPAPHRWGDIMPFQRSTGLTPRWILETVAPPAYDRLTA